MENNSILKKEVSVLLKIEEMSIIAMTIEKDL